jgi:hypothetical protein
MGGFFDFGLGGGCGGRTCHKNLVIVTASTNSNWQVEKLNVTFPLMDAFSDEEVDMVSFGGDCFFFGLVLCLAPFGILAPAVTSPC